MRPRSPSRQRRRTLGVVDQVGVRWAFWGAIIVLAVTVVSIATMIVIGAISPGREFVIVYSETQEVEDTIVDGREVERRGTAIEATGETTRLAIILPVLLLQNTLILVALVVVSIVRGHRISGPVYRMSTDIRKALAGEQDVRIQLRDGDQLGDLAQRINALLEALDSSDRPSSE